MEQIADNFFMLTLPMPFRLMHVHVYVLVHGGVTLIDTGLNTPETFANLEKSLKRIGKDVRDVERILITHYHIDHCGMAGRLQNISGAHIQMSEQSLPFIMARDNKEFIFVERIQNFCREHGLPEKTVDAMTDLFLSFKKAGSAFTINSFFSGETKISIGPWEIQALPTPGHTHDHVAFYFPRERLLLSGDHVLPEITPNLSPNLFAPEFRPLQSFLNSLSCVENLPIQAVYPAHGQPFANLRGRIEEMREHHRVRKGLALKSVQGGTKTAHDVSRDIFGDDLSEFDQFLALNETYVHLVELGAENLIRQGEANGVIRHAAAFVR